MSLQRSERPPVDTNSCAPDSVTPLQQQRVARLLAQHFPRAWRVARRLGLSPALAEEAAQEAYIVLFEKLDRVEEGKELGFLLATVANTARNLRRKASNSREVAHELESFEEDSHQDGADALLDRKRMKEQVDRILSQMSETLRIVFVLYELEQLTLQEISDALEIPLGTTGSRLRLAREAFKKELTRLNRRLQLDRGEP